MEKKLLLLLTALAPPETETTTISSLHLKETIVVTQELLMRLKVTSYALGQVCYLCTMVFTSLLIQRDLRQWDLGQLVHLIAKADDLAMTTIFSQTKDEVNKYSLCSACWQDKHLVSHFTFRVLHSVYFLVLSQLCVEEDGHSWRWVGCCKWPSVLQPCHSYTGLIRTYEPSTICHTQLWI